MSCQPTILKRASMLIDDVRADESGSAADENLLPSIFIGTRSVSRIVLLPLSASERGPEEEGSKTLQQRNIIAVLDGFTGVSRVEDAFALGRHVREINSRVIGQDNHQIALGQHFVAQWRTFHR